RHLTGVWDPQRKSEVRAALLATGKPYAAHAWGETEHLLDGYVDAWGRSRRAGCEVSDSLRGPWLRCLGERLLDLRAVTEELARVDAGTADKAIQLIYSLKAVKSCSDPSALSTRTSDPEHAETRKSVDALRGDLVRARTLGETGRVQEGQRLAEAAVARA